MLDPPVDCMRQVYPLRIAFPLEVFSSIKVCFGDNAMSSVFVFINSKVILVTKNSLFCSTVYYWVLSSLAAE